MDRVLAALLLLSSIFFYAGFNNRSVKCRACPAVECPACTACPGCVLPTTHQLPIINHTPPTLQHTRSATAPAAQGLIGGAC